MNSTNKSLMGKTLLGKTLLSVTLSLSVALTGALAVPAAKVEAASSSTASGVIATGQKFLGVDYKFGATAGSTSSFDCSSFTQYVYKKNGITLPRSSLSQSKAGTYVSRSNLKAGDLIFSDTNRDGVINHVSIYMGNGKLLHTYRKGIGVTISTFSGSTWDKTYVTARRVI
ncbi:cell wall-associated hydrolase [Paenibacillus sp. BIHB 4019]|uniref:Cell wall-associated hydrolase n=1 Tax=Paenibacillus sp. BIHB 4019 TaxID=1870819 RepID=A0A1B2DEL0_9BACL|nr:C40 family peptidase [Paenibacillus sp. BIHB 4019]ANY66135.1 cell wall-associated hydrolase [Paenibacillus sp. BIHB 4019]